MSPEWAAGAMREHQIVITLKPEQFLEVQRLARAANAKSMGMFVRQKLLAALGIEGSLAPSSGGDSALSPQAVNQILTELHRLHGELRGFVAESVSHYSIEPLSERSAAQSGSGTDSAADNAGVIADDFEDLAGRTFAISPRLGAIESPQVVSESAPEISEVPLGLRDPLEVLLSEESLPRLSKPDKPTALVSDDDDEEEYVPLSIRQKRSQMASAQKAAASSETSAASGTADQSTGTAETAAATNKDADAAAANAATGEDKANDTEDEPLPKPVLRPPPPGSSNSSGGNTPFSGGPPPKRRKE